MPLPDDFPYMSAEIKETEDCPRTRQDVGPALRALLTMPPKVSTDYRLENLEAKVDRILDILEGKLVEVPGLGYGRILNGAEPE